MCTGISLSWSSVPTEIIGRHGLARRVCERGDEREIQFHFKDRTPRLPIYRDGRLQIVRWGNGRGQSRFLPRTGWTWLETVQQGDWRHCNPVPVDIPATLGYDRGVWYAVRQGVRGILVPDERGAAVCYMLCEPSSHYYRVMTRSPRMPVLIDERI
jgi:hypothetical protein